MIEALEAGRFFALGAPVFARGYLRHYAELLGEPLEEVTGRYQTLQRIRRLAGHHAPCRTWPPAGQPRARWPLVVVAVALVLGVLIWWAMGVKTA